MLYLTKEWAEDRDRCEEAGLPEEMVVWSKVDLAKEMLERAFEAGVPARWVVALIIQSCGVGAILAGGLTGIAQSHRNPLRDAEGG